MQAAATWVMIARPARILTSSAGMEATGFRIHATNSVATGGKIDRDASRGCIIPVIQSLEQEKGKPLEI